MNAQPTALLLWLRAFHLTAIVCWMAGQLWMWRVQFARRAGREAALLRGPGTADRRVVATATTLAATLALASGAGLLML